MANTIIRIKSSGVIGNTPVTLEPGEIAINYADGKLYYGDSANDAVLFDVITEPAGLDGEIQFNNLGSFGSASGFTFETANTLLRVPNLIVGTTNVVSSITYSWDTANSATILAQSAYDLANTLSGGTADDGYARIVANSAYNQANTATTNAATADQRAVTSGSYANAAFLHANSAFDVANTSLSSIGNSFGQINANVGTILAATANDSLQIVGESGVVVFANSITKTITIAGTPGAQGLTVDYGFVDDSINYSIDYGII
jgi:hypothetical protein